MEQQDYTDLKIKTPMGGLYSNTTMTANTGAGECSYEPTSYGFSSEYLNQNCEFDKIHEEIKINPLEHDFDFSMLKSTRKNTGVIYDTDTDTSSVDTEHDFKIPLHHQEHSPNTEHDFKIPLHHQDHSPVVTKVLRDRYSVLSYDDSSGEETTPKKPFSEYENIHITEELKNITICVFNKLGMFISSVDETEFTKEDMEAINKTVELIKYLSSLAKYHGSEKKSVAKVKYDVKTLKIQPYDIIDRICPRIWLVRNFLQLFGWKKLNPRNGGPIRLMEYEHEICNHEYSPKNFDWLYPKYNGSDASGSYDTSRMTCDIPVSELIIKVMKGLDFLKKD